MKVGDSVYHLGCNSIGIIVYKEYKHEWGELCYSIAWMDGDTSEETYDRAAHYREKYLDLRDMK